MNAFLLQDEGIRHQALRQIDLFWSVVGNVRPSQLSFRYVRQKVKTVVACYKAHIISLNSQIYNLIF